MGATVVLLDGSTVRSGLSRELDFSPADRAEHLRRVAHIARMLNDQGIIVIFSFISPSESIRRQVAEIIGKERFHLIYMDAGVDECKRRKPNLYKQAEEGKLEHLAGADTHYDIPKTPALKLKPQDNSENIEKLVDYLNKQKIFPA